MKRVMVCIVSGLFLVALGWLAFDILVAQPRGLDVERISEPCPEAALNRSDFWTAIRDLDLAGAGGPEATPERRRFVDALRLVVEGDEAGAVREFQSLLIEAEEPRIRDESREALLRLLRSLSRWSELAVLEPADHDAAAYIDAPAEQYSFPPDPVRLRAKIGWLRIPRIKVRLNGQSYEFAVDTGASATVITDEVAVKCAIETSDQSRQEETSTSATIEWWAGLADELRLGRIAIHNHPVAIVRKQDLDLGVIQLDGVIGWTVFQHMRVEIDYGGGEMILTEPEPGVSTGPRNLYWLGYPMVTVHSQTGVPLQFGLDTGARKTSLKPNIRNKVELGPLESDQKMTIGAGGSETVIRQRAANFVMSVGNRQFRFKRISIDDGVKDLAVLAPDGQLGGDVAYHGRMIVDFPNADDSNWTSQSGSERPNSSGAG